ncbi:hypothetical protein [Candidatus Nasuia deltocephalinicola]|uniref:hypothetical protein n=1 Tax=Candidatus Nasuia deltocephalincola TaxID=1160784 RepID=UPI00216ABB1D|nr:hypothetical protein [Candidatus Nasuia deltocephalinicola]
MLVLLLNNFFIFNFLYSFLNFNKKYISNYLIFFKKIIISNIDKKFFYKFKKIFFFKILIKNKILKRVKFYNLKIFIFKKNFFNFRLFEFLKINKILYYKFLIKKILFNNLLFYIINLLNFNFYIKILIILF